MTDDLMTETEIPESEDADTGRPETVEESARAVMEELQANAQEANESEGNQGEERAQPTVDASEAARILARSKGGKKGAKRQVVEAKDLEPEPDPQAAQDEPQQTPSRRFDPPQRFPVEKKEWFLRQPPEVQEEVVRGWGELESHTTKLWQDMNRERDKAAGVNQILDRYAPQFHERGFTEVQFMAEMAATWSNLQKDPLTTIDKIARNFGITPEQLYQLRQQGGAPAQAAYPVQQPQKSLTIEDVRTILREEREQLHTQSATSAAAAEVQQLQSLRSADGTKYLYPELHDTQYLKGLQPLVQHLRETHPTLSWGEIFKGAVHTSRHLAGSVAVESLSPNGSRLSPQEISAVKQASVSIRGRGNASVPVIAEAKKGESVRESALAAYAALKSNQQH